MADRDNMSTLEELEPSPVDETPSTNAGEYFPSTDTSHTKSSPATSIGLSSGHSPVWYLTRVQKFSAFAFSAFATFHITNTSLIPLLTQSVPASEPYLLLTRPYYQSWPIAEPLLIILPLAAHIGSGVALRLYRRNLAAKRYGAETRDERRAYRRDLWPKVSGTSQLGYLALPLLMGHTFINRIIPAGLPGGSSNVNLSYVSHAFAKHPIVSYAGFAALISVTMWHTTWGGAKYLGLTPDAVKEQGTDRQILKKRRWYIINAIAAAGTALWMAGGFGVVGRAGAAGGWVGRLYDEMYQKIPVVGAWM